MKRIRNTMIDPLFHNLPNKPLNQKNTNNRIENVEHKFIALEEALREYDLNNVNGVLDYQSNDSGQKPNGNCEEISELFFTQVIPAPFVKCTNKSIEYRIRFPQVRIYLRLGFIVEFGCFRHPAKIKNRF